MACKRLADKYTAATGLAVPGSESLSWLYNGQWMCKDTSGNLHDKAWCTNTANNAVHAYKTNALGPTPELDTWVETGFLPWMNERGVQCINKLTGKIAIPGLAPQCVSQCIDLTPDSHICFDCIKTQLVKPEYINVCPNTPATARTIDVLEEAVQGMYDVRSHIADKTVWDCVTDDPLAPPSSTSGPSVNLILAYVLLPIIAVLAYVWLSFFQKYRHHMKAWESGPSEHSYDTLNPEDDE